MPTQVQNINGTTYAPYTPEWYDAQKNAAIRSAGIGGTAEGTGESNYLSAVSPSLAGLYSAISSGTGGSGTSSLPARVGYGSTAGAFGGNGFSIPSVSSSTLGGNDSSFDLSNVPSVSPVDLTRANANAFATAKDQAAKTATASLSALRSALASRGMGGAGYEAGLIGQTLAREANTIGEASRAEAEKEADLRAQESIANLSAGLTARGQNIGALESAANRAAAARQAAYTGGITQRGQDISAQTEAERLAAENANNAFSGAIAQRGQDITAAQQAADLAQRQAALKSSQTLSILQSVMNGGRGPFMGNGYVY